MTTLPERDKMVELLEVARTLVCAEQPPDKQVVEDWEFKYLELRVDENKQMDMITDITVRGGEPLPYVNPGPKHIIALYGDEHADILMTAYGLIRILGKWYGPVPGYSFYRGAWGRQRYFSRGTTRLCMTLTCALGVVIGILLGQHFS